MRITLYMLREGVDLSRGVLRDGTTFQEVTLQPAADIDWTLFVRSSDLREAAWVRNVRPVVVNPDQLLGLRSQSSAGVLLARTGDHTFAVTFSHGFHALDPKYLVPGFGLKVTANVIAANQVTSADTKGFSQSSRSQKTVLSAANELYALGIEPSEEWVRQLSGKVASRDFATTAAGADSLKLSIRDFSLKQLPEKLRQIVSRYESDDYQSSFGFIDNFIRLDRKDPLVDELDAEVEQLLLASSDDLGFAAPDPFEQLHVDHFVIRYRKDQLIEELTTDEVYAALRQLKLPQTDPMHRVSVFALNEEDELVDKKYDLYNYIQAQVRRPEGLYALTAGAWFRIASSYLEEVDSYLATIDDLTAELNLPVWNRKELDKVIKESGDKSLTAEGLYNSSLADDRGLALLDKRNLYFGRNQKIEICDLLTSDRKLLCVKRASQSSTLSHLFAQGSVSASLMNEPAYRERLMESLAQLVEGPGYGNPADWTFVYAIATEKSGPLSKSLFFFSKVNLVTNVRAIRSRSYKTAVARIEVV